MNVDNLISGSSIFSKSYIFVELCMHLSIVEHIKERNAVLCIWSQKTYSFFDFFYDLFIIKKYVV